MVYTKQDFETRVKAVDGSKKSLVRRGATHRVGKNGIIVVEPKSARRTMRLPIRGVLVMIACFFGFKALLLAANGPDTYNDRLASLENGNVVAVWGARALAVDPVTQFIADQIAPVLR